MKESQPSESFTLRSGHELEKDSITDVVFSYRSDRLFMPDARISLYYETRQGPGVVQTDDVNGENYITAYAGDREIPVRIHPLEFRTLDLYPHTPEFVIAIDCMLGPQGLGPDESVAIKIHRWKAPSNPIDEFSFWLLVDDEAKWDFEHQGFRSYRIFVDRRTRKRISPDEPVQRLLKTTLKVTGEFPVVPDINRRKTPGVLWGEIHGMSFNQRRLDDFYNYAKNVTDLDFCALELFSYNICVGNVWQEVKDAARRHTVPGEFVALAAFECGTYPDDSHRCAYFPQPEHVPPIFCDSRPPAQDPLIHARFHEDTVYCKTLDAFYATVERYGGFVTGHMHTLKYDRELLAEMWQKRMWPGNEFNAKEENRIFENLRQGKRFGFTGGSDSHDSMPGNPYPEFSMEIPGPNTDLLGPAGFTGIWADELTVEALTEALLARRVFATSGARIALNFASEGHPMGSELPLSAERSFSLSVDATSPIRSVELLHDGRPTKTWSPEDQTFEIEYTDKDSDTSGASFYLVRVIQDDGHRGWSSPIWFG